MNTQSLMCNEIDAILFDDNMVAERDIILYQRFGELSELAMRTRHKTPCTSAVPTW